MGQMEGIYYHFDGSFEILVFEKNLSSVYFDLHHPGEENCIKYLHRLESDISSKSSLSQRMYEGTIMNIGKDMFEFDATCGDNSINFTCHIINNVEILVRLNNHPDGKNWERKFVRFKKGIIHLEKDLTVKGVNLIIFNNPDITFYAQYPNDYSDHEFVLEEGTEFNFKADTMTNEEIKEWAGSRGSRDRGYIDDELDEIEKKLLENEILDYDALRQEIRNEEIFEAYHLIDPKSRAFAWFRGKRFKFPKDIEMELHDYESHDDILFVSVKTLESLKKLQLFLSKKGFNVNFIGKSEL